jgi:hypothetical protein
VPGTPHPRLTKKSNQGSCISETALSTTAKRLESKTTLSN